MLRNAIDASELVEAELKCIWKEKIKEDYSEGRVNSERALQACLYSHLRNTFDSGEFADREIEIFIEPKLDGPAGLGNLKNKVPDILIAQGGKHRKIIAWIELKFAPQGYVGYRADLRKFLSLKKSGDRKTLIHLHVDPKTGWWREDSGGSFETFEFSKDTWCCYAAIGRADSEAFFPKEYPDQLKSIGHLVILAGKINYPSTEENQKHWEFVVLKR